MKFVEIITFHWKFGENCWISGPWDTKKAFVQIAMMSKPENPKQDTQVIDS